MAVGALKSVNPGGIASKISSPIWDANLDRDTLSTGRTTTATMSLGIAAGRHQRNKRTIAGGLVKGMDIVSIISDRPDYHSIFVRNGEDVIELVSTSPWRGLLWALLRMKVLKLNRRFHAERQTGIQNSIPVGIPTHRFALSSSGKILVLAPKTREFPGRHQVLGVHGQSVDELRGPAIAKANPGRREPEAAPSDRSPVA